MQVNMTCGFPMNTEVALSLLGRYESQLNHAGYAPIECLDNVPVQAESLNHALTMFPRMRMLILMGEEEKFSRWLGFVQGVLFTRGVYTIAEMREHNRPIFKARNDETGQR